ncbi:dienelactone hydrolase [Calothrix sp. 336/3]|nr:dienelactone hydrolase [Calothrix sp. 336/3]
MATPATLAAETVTIRFGSFQQAIAVADLEEFAKTGKLPKNLKLFSSILTPQVRGLLSQRLQIDPKIGDKFVAGLSKIPAGKQFISSLGAIIPGSTAESLEATLNIALRQVNGLTALSFVRAYPQENVTIDASKAISFAVEFNPRYLQSQAFNLLLTRELDATAPSTTRFKSTLNPAAPGKLTVQTQTLSFRDSERNRTIIADIYGSQGDKQQPLVVISHGFGANRQFLTYLANHLSSHGVTVAAIEHPGSNSTAVRTANTNLAKLMPATEFIDRPQDISFLLNQLAKINLQPGRLQGKLNTEKVTVIGHSLGGYTALALAGGEINLKNVREFCRDSLSFLEAPADWLQCAATNLPEKKLQLGDSRVKSAIALNPLVGKLFGDKGLSKIRQPILILTSTADTITPSLKHQLVPFSQISGTKYLLTAVGATHLSIGDPKYQANNTLVRERRGKDTASLRMLTQGVSLAFIKQLTPEANQYKQFLSSAYTQSLSGTELPLRLVSELPTNVESWLEKIQDKK